MSYMIFVFLCLTSFSKIISRWTFLTFVAEEDLANHMEFEQGLEKMTMHCTTLAKIVGCRSQIQVSEILKLLLPLPTLSTNRVLSCKCEVKVLVSQSCLTVCDPMDCSLADSSVHGIPQVRILEWVAIALSRASSWPRDRTCLSYVSCIGRRVLYH